MSLLESVAWHDMTMIKENVTLSETSSNLGIVLKQIVAKLMDIIQNSIILYVVRMMFIEGMHV